MDPPQSPVLLSPDRIRVGERVTLFRTSRSPRWYAQFNRGGRQHRVSLRTRSLKQARSLAAKLDAELTLGIIPNQRNRRPTIVTIVQRYVESKARHVRPHTLALYQTYLEQFAAYCTSRHLTRADALSADRLEEYERWLEKADALPPTASGVDRGETSAATAKGRSRRGRVANLPGTIRAKLKIVRQVIRWMIRRELLERDPAAGYRLPRQPKRQAAVFSPAELKAILATAPEPYREVFDFLRMTGLRNEELCWLTGSDVDPQLRFIHIRPKTCPVTGEQWEPKHGNSRIVPLCDEAKAIVKRRLAAGGTWLFASSRVRGRRPGQFDRWQIWKALRKVLSNCGIGHGSVHSFRHSYCSFLANRGVPAFVVMRCLGHSSLDIVLTYFHSTDDDLVEGVAPVNFAEMTEPRGKNKPESSEVPSTHSSKE